MDKQITERWQEIKAPGKREYSRYYDKGFRAAGILGEAEQRFVAQHGSAEGWEYDAWMDGALDNAASRPKWHYRDHVIGGACDWH